ncbi:MAG: diguanylate cyclase [Lachnospiraceae bacterium]|nr:diguanylate cyclase [Lachnospiraceae bacterium]
MAEWVIVVDDDTANLKVAGHILSGAGMRVTALKSGKTFLEYVREKGAPDLVLLDINMPEMDGFETLKSLRDWEKAEKREEMPVVFLTADETADRENQSYAAGVLDYIRKPFEPDILVKRIDNILSRQRRISTLKNEAETDAMTGLLNKAGVTKIFAARCAGNEGCLMMIDLDSFKLVNDIYGHDAGDEVLRDFAEDLRNSVPEGSSLGRIGGDEFIAFIPGAADEEKLREFTAGLNERIAANGKRIMGEDTDIPLGVSVGAVMVPEWGTVPEELRTLADKALYRVKTGGKHGFALYKGAMPGDDDGAEGDLKTISAIMGERNILDTALMLDRTTFPYVYQFIMRYLVRNRGGAGKVLFTLSPEEGVSEEEFAECCDSFGEQLKNSLRKSDIITQSRSNQYFVLLIDVRADSVRMVVENAIGHWRSSGGTGIRIRYESEYTGADADRDTGKEG